MSEELEQRLARTQHELVQVQRELEAAKAELDAPDSAQLKLQAQVDKSANDLSARKEAIDELAREVEQLREEARQVAEAALNP